MVKPPAAGIKVLLLSTMLPVEVPPIFKVCLLVVKMLPVASRERALLLAQEIEAVGVPLFTLIKPNLADAVEIPPTNRSTVVFFGVSAPLN